MPTSGVAAGCRKPTPRAQDGWRDFDALDFHLLNHKYGVTWVVVENPGVPGLACPYRSEAVQVCRID